MNSQNTTAPRGKRKPYQYSLADTRRWLRNKRKSKMPVKMFRRCIRRLIAAMRVLKKCAKLQMQGLALKDERALPTFLAHLHNTSLAQLKAKWSEAHEISKLLTSALARAV